MPLEDQTAGPTEDVDGKSAAPASQHVVDVKTSGVRVRPPRVLQFALTGQIVWAGSPRRLPGRRCEVTGWRRGKSPADFLREVGFPRNREGFS
jgi:hypothetical protein